MRSFMWQRGQLIADPQTTLAIMQGCVTEKPIVANNTAYCCAYLGNDNYRIFEGKEEDINIMSSFLKKCDNYSIRNASTSALWNAAIA